MTFTQRPGTRLSYSSRRNATAFAGLSCEARYAGRSINSGPLAKTILLVDDEPCLLEVRRLVFEALGYRVLTADSGEEALEVLQADAVDSVVLDYLLTGMDGAEAGRRIRKAHPNLPVILSSSGFAAADRALESANAFVSKGAGLEALIEVLEQQLQLVPDGRPHPTEPACLSQSAE